MGLASVPRDPIPLLGYGALTSLAAFALLSLSGSSSAAGPAADIDFDWAPLEPTVCRDWQPSGVATWNFSLAANGSDTSLNTTKVLVWVGASNSSALVADAWQLGLSAEGDLGSTPPSFESNGSVTSATGLAALSPSPGGIELYLYSGNHSPPAPTTTLRLWLGANEDSLNTNHYFNITAQAQRSGQLKVTRTIELCASVPPKPRFGLSNTTGTLQTLADSYVVVNFRLENTGNTPDYYLCNMTLSGKQWFSGFTSGVAYTGGANRTAILEPHAALLVGITVYVPVSARAFDNATVSLWCNGYKAMQSGILFLYGPYVRVEVPFFRYICHAIHGDPSIAALPGERVVFNLSFVNRGNGPDTGKAWVTYGNLSWVDGLEPATFTIAADGDPGSEVQGTLAVLVPQGARLRTYDFQINVTSATGPAAVCRAVFHVEVRQAYSVLALGGSSATLSVGEELTGSFTIHNTGNGADQLRLSVKSDPGWVVFLDPAISSKFLQVGEAAAFRIRIIPPPATLNATVGVHHVTLHVASEYAAGDGLDVSSDLVWEITIRPVCDIAVLPVDTYAEVNPSASAQGPLIISWPLSVQNLGNAPAVITFNSSTGSEVSLSSSFNNVELAVGERIEGSVSAEIPREQPGGILEIPIKYTACGGDAVARAWIHVQVVVLDLVVRSPVKATLQDPARPEWTNSSKEVTSVKQAEGFRIEFSIRVFNAADLPVAPAAFELQVFDEFSCPGAIRGPTDVQCGATQLPSVRLDSPLEPGEERWLPFTYAAPDFVCFENRECAVDGVPDNLHTLRFRAVVANESNVENNEVSVAVHIVTLASSDPPATSTGGSAVALMAGGAAVAVAAVGLALLLRRRRRAP